MRFNQIVGSALPLGLVVAGIAVLGITGNLLSPSPLVIAVQVAAVGLNVWARVSFKTGTFRITAAPGVTSIITLGPYRFIRHPMYCALLIFVWAGVASHLSVLTVAIGVALTAIAVARVIVEERLLRAKFPEYPAYSKSTKALIPFLF